MGEQYGFKTEFRGFARADVLKYIDELRLQLQTKQEDRRAETEALRAELAETKAQLADVPQAAIREEELRAALAEAEAGAEALRAQIASLGEELEAARAAYDPDREQELVDSLSEVRGEVRALRERESELTAQLAETHRAVAKLWQEKEAAERKVTIALTFADELQAHTADLKQRLSGDAPVDGEGGTGKPMERWLF